VSKYVFEPPRVVSVPVHGGGLFPVRRIFCIGRNYSAHVKEMGNDPKSSPPIFFGKPADAITPSGAKIPYPLHTRDLHYEAELVVALKSGGVHILQDDALGHVFGYAAGCDLTRRDLQREAKERGAPWMLAKGFDHSAPIGAIARIEDFTLADDARITLSLNGATRQDATLNEMIWSVPEIIESLAERFELKPGDLIYTGSPEGVGPLQIGDKVEITIGDMPALTFTMTELQ